MENGYIIKKCFGGDGDIFYYKNGKLHRENGPAVIYLEDKPNITDQEETQIYKTVIVNNQFPSDYAALFVDEEVAKYYLEGKPYSKEEYYALKWKKELSTELSVNPSTTKKAKI